MDFNKAKLEDAYILSLKIIGKKHVKKYNLKTVNNLIFHFDKIEQVNKELVYNELYNYLVFIRDIKIDSSSKESKSQSHELYNSFISPLIKYYLPLGFSANLSWLVLIFVVIFSTPILVILNSSIVWYIGVYAVFMALKLKSWMKEREHKVYGPLW